MPIVERSKAEETRLANKLNAAGKEFFNKKITPTEKKIALSLLPRLSHKTRVNLLKNITSARGEYRMAFKKGLRGLTYAELERLKHVVPNFFSDEFKTIMNKHESRQYRATAGVNKILVEMERVAKDGGKFIFDDPLSFPKNISETLGFSMKQAKEMFEGMTPKHAEKWNALMMEYDDLVVAPELPPTIPEKEKQANAKPKPPKPAPAKDAKPKEAKPATADKLEPTNIDEALAQEYFTLVPGNKGIKKKSAQTFINLFHDGVEGTVNKQYPPTGMGSRATAKRKGLRQWIEKHKQHQPLVDLVTGKREFAYPELMKGAKPHPELVEIISKPQEKMRVGIAPQQWDMDEKYNEAIRALYEEKVAGTSHVAGGFAMDAERRRNMLNGLVVKAGRSSLPGAYEGGDQREYLRGVVVNWVKKKHTQTKSPL
ncbi:hypothetical protein ACFLQ2_00340 [archaeon]